MKFIHSLPDILDRKRFSFLLFSRIRYAHRTACVQGWIDRILDGGTSAFFSILVAGSTSREIGYQPTRTGSLHLWTGRKRPRSSLLLYLFGHGNRGTQSFRPRERPSREFRYPQSLRSASLFDMRLTLNNASLASSRRASSVLLSRDRITDL